MIHPNEYKRLRRQAEPHEMAEDLQLERTMHMGRMYDLGGAAPQIFELLDAHRELVRTLLNVSVHWHNGKSLCAWCGMEMDERRVHIAGCPVQRAQNLLQEYE